mgnify:CR=1 FL=1
MDNQDIALNIVMSGYQALCLVQEDDGYYFSADSFIEEMRAIQFTGSCSVPNRIAAHCASAMVALMKSGEVDSDPHIHDSKIYPSNSPRYLEYLKEYCEKYDMKNEGHVLSMESEEIE